MNGPIEDGSDKIVWFDNVECKIKAGKNQEI